VSNSRDDPTDFNGRYPIVIQLKSPYTQLTTRYPATIELRLRTEEELSEKEMLAAAAIEAIEEAEEDEETEETEEEEETGKVEVRIKSVANDGLVLLVFTEPMKVSDELIVLINNSTNKTEEDEEQPPLRVEIIAGEDTNKSDTEFTWNMTKFSGREMEIQLNFTKPHAISMNEFVEQLQITFNDALAFLSEDGNFVKRDLLITKEIPSQFNITGGKTKQFKAFMGVAKTIMSSLMTSNIAISFMAGVALNLLWSMIEA